MLSSSKAFSGFSVDDLDAAAAFYTDVLGLDVGPDEDGMGVRALHLPGGGSVMVYGKPGHQPATFTVLNFSVPDVGAAVDELAGRGVRFERYEGFDQDERGIHRGGGPLIAWFTDPAGNVMAVLEAGDGLG